MLQPNTKILIVGLGLLGGSYAMALTEAGYEVGAVDLSAKSIAYALEKGIIAHGESQVSEAYLKNFDLVVLALYPETAVWWIKTYQTFLKPLTIPRTLFYQTWQSHYGLSEFFLRLQPIFKKALILAKKRAHSE